MIGKRSIFIHAGLVVTGAVIALGVWTRDKNPKALARGDVTVWQGRPADVERLVYEDKKKRLELTAKKDDLGRYYVGAVEKDKPPPKPLAADAGAPEPPPAEKVVTGLLSIGPAEKLLEMLAPLRAVRSVGQVPAEREGEFGLGEPEGTLTVTLKGGERKLVFGGPTPGGGDRYVRDPQSGEVYVVKADIFRNVDTPESSLQEKELHEWKDADIVSAKVTAGGKSRTIVRGGTEQKRFWADDGAKDTPDETLGNWMVKVDRLRPTDFPQTPPEPKEIVVRIDYSGTGGNLGHVEVVRQPAAGEGKPQYFIATERTRGVYGKVAASAGEQVEQDIGTILQ